MNWLLLAENSGESKGHRHALLVTPSQLHNNKYIFREQCHNNSTENWLHLHIITVKPGKTQKKHYIIASEVRKYTVLKGFDSQRELPNIWRLFSSLYPQNQLDLNLVAFLNLCGSRVPRNLLRGRIICGRGRLGWRDQRNPFPRCNSMGPRCSRHRMLEHWLRGQTKDCRQLA